MTKFAYFSPLLHYDSVLDCFTNDIENESESECDNEHENESKDKSEGEDDDELDEQIELPPRLVKGWDEYDQRTPLIEDTETINVGTTLDLKELKIGTTLDLEEKQGFLNLLHEFEDVFA